MDLLLDSNIIIDICCKKKAGSDRASELIEAAILEGSRVWLLSALLPIIQLKLTDTIINESCHSETDNLSRRDAIREATLKIREFSGNKQWLSTLAPSEHIFNGEDIEEEMLINSLELFQPGTVMLLTGNKNILKRCTAAISPEEARSSDCFKPLFELRNRETLDRNIEKISTICSGDPPDDKRPGRIPSRKIEFTDLKRGQDAIRPDLEKRVHTVLHHGAYIMGKEVEQLEKRLAEYVGVRHCVSASSGSDTLLIALMALGIGAGDEVITSPFTFIATGEMIALLGAVPVFVDIDPLTLNIDPTKIEAAITKRTRAIMPVSLYGQCADFDKINMVAEKYAIPVIEDGAQSFGATYGPRMSCALSLIGSTSFFPSKPLGAYGDGGALFTDDDTLADMFRKIRIHGQAGRYNHVRIGINGRLDTLQAAVLLTKMDLFDKEIKQRQHIAERYSELLRQYCPDLVLPYIMDPCTSVFAQYTVQSEHRCEIIHSLELSGIPTAIHYPTPLHRQPVFAHLGYEQGSLPVAESASRKVFSLPMGPYLTEEEQNFVVTKLAEAMTCQRWGP